MAGCKCTCPGCGQEIQVDENLIGVEFSCPLCSAPIRVSEETGELSEESEEDTAPETGIPIAKPAGEKPLRLKSKVPPVRPVSKPSPRPPVRPVSEPVAPPPPPPPMPERNFSAPFYGNEETADRLAGLLRMIALLLIVVIVALVGSAVWIRMQLNGNNEKLIQALVPGYEEPEEDSEDSEDSEVQSPYRPVREQAARYDYKIVTLEGNYVFSKMERKEIDSDKLQGILQSYSDWELVDVIEEVETVHPNFGNSEYVTGLQPNVRTWRVQLILRKRK